MRATSSLTQFRRNYLKSAAVDAVRRRADGFPEGCRFNADRLCCGERRRISEEQIPTAGHFKAKRPLSYIAVRPAGTVGRHIPQKNI